MRWWPCSAAPLEGKRFPLPDSTAAALINALIAADTPSRADALVTALQWDPALVLWTVCELAGQPVSSVDQLATSTAERLPDLLAGTADGEPLKQVDNSQQPVYRQLAVRSVLIARRAELLAQQQDPESAPRAYLFGLIHNWPAWSEKAASSHSEIPVPSSAAELDQLLEPFLGPPTESGLAAAEFVIQALQSERAVQVAKVEPASDEDPVTDVQQWWAAAIPLSVQLPSFAGRWQRLQRLESDFAVALEEEKLQSMYKLAAGAGHEINNPLGSIAGRAQLLLRDETDPDRRRTLAKINSQAFRAHEMISDMMLFARPPAPIRQPIDVAELINGVVVELREVSEQRETEIVGSNTGDVATIEADPTQLVVALRAMCMNAMEALGHGGRIDISARSLPESESEKSVEISIRDNGPGLSSEQHRHLFDPFYSGREAGRGLGFGLSKCWRIIRNHGGAIDVESTPGHGATFRIRLPAA